MKKISFVLALLPACLGLLACVASNTPNPVRYTLTPLAPECDAAAPAVPFARIAVPAYLDTPQIVTRKSDNVVVINEAKTWAEPLARSIQRALPILVSQNLRGKKLKNFGKFIVNCLMVNQSAANPGKAFKAARKKNVRYLFVLSGKVHHR